MLVGDPRSTELRGCRGLQCRDGYLFANDDFSPDIFRLSRDQSKRSPSLVFKKEKRKVGNPMTWDSPMIEE